MFGPEDVKVKYIEQIFGTPFLEGQRLESIYVMSAESAYVDKTKTRKNVQIFGMHAWDM